MRIPRFFTTEAAERLADRLIADAPPGLTHVYLVSGGSEAVEAALKMARQYFVEIGEPQRRHVVARRQSYHGNTLGALATGGNAWRRAPFQPLLIETRHIAPCYAYRLQREGESEADYAARAAQGLEDEILALGPETVMAFVAETVVGATAGAVPPVGDYFQRIRDDLRPLRRAAHPRRGDVRHGPHRHAARLRAGRRRARPDDDRQGARRRLPADRRGAAEPAHLRRLRRTAPAPSSTATPIWAIRWPRRRRSRCRRSIRRDGLLANVGAMGARLERRLEARFGQHPYVGDIRGRGLFRGVELVADRATKAPFDPGRNLHARVKREAMARGLMVYPMGGTIDGRHGDHVLLAPPFIVTAGQIEAIVERLGDATEAALG